MIQRLRISGLLITLFTSLFTLLLNFGTPVTAQDQPLRVALSAPTTPINFTRIHGAVSYGAEFGLQMTADDFIIFDSHTLATQSVLAGEAEVAIGSFMSTLLVRQAGQDFKVFCPNVGVNDQVLVGRNGITTLEQVFDPNTRVAVTSAGAGGDATMNAVFRGNGIDQTSADIPNAIEMGTSSVRMAAWANNEVDVAMVQLNQFRQAQDEVPDAVLIATLYESVPLFIFTSYSAPTAWLDENLETAAALCATGIKSSFVLSTDFEAYNAALQAFLTRPPAQEETVELFDMINQYDFWMLKTGITPEHAEFMIDLAVDTGLLESAPDAAEVLDMRPYEMALELLGDQIDLDQLSGTAQP
jgi:hypothetical protein